MNSIPIERILVPTDMSEFADLALEYALLFQKRFQSEVTLLRAEDFSFLFTAEFPLGYYLENASSWKKHAQELLRNYARGRIPGMKRVNTLVVDDMPARAIVRTADDIRADLIIMGTHGRHGLRRALLGSVTERVLRDTDRPVMTVTPQVSPAKAAMKMATILCPVNFTEVARTALEYACGFAQAFDAELIVMSVSETEDTRGTSVEAQFKDWVDPLVRGRTRYQQVLVSGEPAARVLEVADQIAPDLIVIGAQHKRFSDSTVIGTTTERITRFAKQPVLTLVRRTTVEKRQEKREPAAALA